MDLSGGLDGLPLLFWFWTGAVRIQRGLFAMFLYALFYDAVRNCQYAIHEIREEFVLD